MTLSQTIKAAAEQAAVKYPNRINGKDGEKMKLAEIKSKAMGLGIKAGKMNKEGLIHAIQKQEGNFDCFGTAEGFCDQWDCCFRLDCFKPQVSH